LLQKRSRQSTITRLQQPARPATPKEQAQKVQPTPEWLQLQEAQPIQGRSGSGLLVNMLWLLFGMLGGVSILAVYLYFGQLLIPNSQTLGLDLGGLTVQEATALLEGRWANRQIGLQMANGAQLEVTPEQLGIRLEARRTVEFLHQDGRTLEGLLTLLSSEQTLSMQPFLRFDPEAAADNLAALAPRFAIAAIDATLQVTEGRAVILPARGGQRLDIPATIEGIAANPHGVVMAGSMTPVIVPVEAAIQQADLEAVAAQVNGLMSRPLQISLYDPIADEDLYWEVAPQRWGGWLAFDLQPADGTPFHWAVEPAKLKQFLDEQSALLGSDRYLSLDSMAPAVTEAVSSGRYAIEQRVYHQDRYHVVQAGETLSSIGWNYGIPYPWIEQANPAAAERLWVGQGLVIPSVDRLLPLPVARNKRITISISQQRMWAYENGSLKWEWPVSTGIDSSPTVPGIFQIQSHEQNAYAGNWDLWMPYFMGIYEPAPGANFMNGFHGFPTRDQQNLLWVNDLGRKATYGCILISTDNAALLFNWAESGVIVEVKP
jgi:lipoprotein-anchoring transpeptidase ErfK/SrfK